MPAYLIIAAKVHDREAFLHSYAPVAAELIERFGGEYLLRGPGAETLEGDFPDGASIVISKWPDKQAAKAFWDSPEYADAKQLREGLADVQVLLIEGPDIATISG
ncbi:MAG: DUF1330 domain-containing protein [Erythrobacter sp.]